jgi:predicted metal-binding protein
MGHVVTIIDRKYTADDTEVEYIDGLKIVRLESPRFKRFNFTVNFILTQICFGRRVNKYLKMLKTLSCACYTTISSCDAFLNRSIRKKLFYTSVGLRRDKKSP